MLNRRNFVVTGAAGALSLGFAPRLAFAQAATDKRFIFIIQRGAADGLGTLAPVGDRAFAAQRGVLAEEFAQAPKLDSMFALHPNLKYVAQLYAAKEALFVHAVERLQIRCVMARLLMLPAPNHVDGTVHGDPMEPRAEVRPRLEAGKLPVRLEKRLLDDVFGVLGAAGHPVGQPVDSTAMALDERTESLAISVARQRDGGGVRLRHPIG